MALLAAAGFDGGGAAAAGGCLPPVVYAVPAGTVFGSAAHAEKIFRIVMGRERLTRLKYTIPESMDCLPSKPDISCPGCTANLTCAKSIVLDARDTTHYYPFSFHLIPNNSGYALLVSKKPHLEQPQQAREAR